MERESTIEQGASAPGIGERLPFGLPGGVVPVAILALAAALRLWAIGHDAANPFYDAAVRSMGLSWHNFFFGALEPGGSLAIDKPPIDLWLQVASTKILGFNRAALQLPEALGGIASVGLLYGAIRRACGPLAGSLAALALAVLPISVLTSRSDTMDSVMAALLIAALWCSIEALQTRRARHVLLGAALVGIAFNVKLTQALVPLPALALMWWAASSGRRRMAMGAGALAVLAIVAMAWAFTASLTPLHGRPYPIGSRTGSIYRAMFVFNGVERLTGSSPQLAPVRFSSASGPVRLLRSARSNYGALIGLELVAACALLGAAAALWLVERNEGRKRAVGARPPPGHRSVAGSRSPPAYRSPRGNHAVHWLLGALAVWLLTTFVLFSAVSRLQARYLEAMSPAVAALIGIAAAYLLGHARSPRAAWLCAGALALNAAFALSVGGVPRTGVTVCVLASALAMAGLCVAPLRRVLFDGDSGEASLIGFATIAVVALALLAAPARTSINLIRQHASDANPAGSGIQFSSYLRAHRGHAHYETAAANPLAVVGLIMRDAQPVLILRYVGGPSVPLGSLQRLVREGAVRFIILPQPCVSGERCPATTSWSVHNAVRVRPGLYRFLAPGQLR